MTTFEPLPLEKLRDSLYMHIMRHLNSRGFYDGAPLPDAPDEPFDYGATDTRYFSQDIVDTDRQQVELVKMDTHVKRWLFSPTQETLDALYQAATEVHMITLFRPLVQHWRDENLPFGQMLDLSRHFVCTSRHREAVKLGYALAAAMGLRNVREHYSEGFYTDLRQTAICDEFSVYFLMSTEDDDRRQQRDIEYLAHHTRGWGRAVAITMYPHNTPRRRRWLLLHGMDLHYFWPPIAPFIIQQTQLQQWVAQPEPMQPDEVHAGLSVTEAFLEFLIGTMYEREASQMQHSLKKSLLQGRKDAQAQAELAAEEQEAQLKESMEEAYTRSISLYPLLQGLLAQAPALENTQLPLLVILAHIKAALESWQERHMYKYLTPNQLNALIGDCDRLLYAHDLNEMARTRLFRGNKLNTPMLRLCQLLELDVLDRLYPLWLKHPTHPMLFDFVQRAMYKSGQAETLLADACDRVNELLADENIMADLIRMSGDYKGCGIPLFKAALLGDSDYLRGLTLMMLKRWERDALPPDLLQALEAARSMVPEQSFMGMLFQSVVPAKKSAENWATDAPQGTGTGVNPGLGVDAVSEAALGDEDIDTMADGISNIRFSGLGGTDAHGTDGKPGGDSGDDGMLN